MATGGKCHCGKVGVSLEDSLSGGGKLSHLTQTKSGAQFIGPGEGSRQSQARMFIFISW